MNELTENDRLEDRGSAYLLCVPAGEDNLPATNLCATPNQHARVPALEISALLHGYQEFRLTRETIEPLSLDPNTCRKAELLAPYFNPSYLANRTVLDLGANNAFFCFWALQQNAAQATALDIDEAYLQQVEAAKTALGFDTLSVVKANVADLALQAEVTQNVENAEQAITV